MNTTLIFLILSVILNIGLLTLVSWQGRLVREATLELERASKLMTEMSEQIKEALNS